MSGVGFEPTRANTADLKCSPLDHSGIQTGGVAPFFCFFCFCVFLWIFIFCEFTYLEMLFLSQVYLSLASL